MNRHLRRARRHDRSLGLEQLESRVVLAGNVHAFISGGNLHLDGDSRANEILIEQSAHGTFTISSRDGTTTINGHAGPITLNGIRQNVLINLNGGNDVAELDGGSGGPALIVRNSLNVDLGSGADQLLMSNVHVLHLHVNMGTGNDLINIGSDGDDPGVMVTKEAVVLTGTGQDDARIANSLFKRYLTLDMGNNNDTTTIQNTSVHRRSVINGSSGTDTLNRQDNHGKFKFLSYEVVNNSVMSPAPLPPIAGNDTATVARGQSTTINVAANDNATPGQTINNGSITITQPPAHGTATANANGTVLYTNNGDTAATDTFKYTIKDSAGATSNAATVTVTVNGPLQANNDAASITEDATPTTVTGNVLTNDTGGTGAKTVSAVNSNAGSVGTSVPGTHGQFQINADGTFTYTLNNNDETVNGLANGQTLTDSIGYTAKAGAETSNATLNITINGHTDLVANADTGSVTEDATVNTATGNVLTNDTGGNGATNVSAVNGSAANVGATVQGQHGAFKINSDGTFTYTLNNADTDVNNLNDGQTLQDQIGYTSTDGIASASSTLTITINGTSELTAAPDAASVTEDATPNTAAGNVLTNDAGGTGAKTVTAVNGSAANVGTNVPGSAAIGGTFKINSDGTFTYTLDNTNTAVNNLNNGQTLTDTATYTVTAGASTSTATVTVTINGHTELVAGDDAASVTEDSSTNPINGNVLTNDVGGSGAKTVTAVSGNAAGVGADVPGQHGMFHINSDGTFTYTLDNTQAAVNALNNGDTLQDTINYTVGDSVTTDVGTITVTINGHTELVANADATDVTEDAATDQATGNVLTNDTGGNGTKTVTAVNASASNIDTDVPGVHGTFHIKADGSFTYTLNNGDTAVNNLNTGDTLQDSIDYTTSDGIATASSTLTVTIHGTTELQATPDAGDINEDATTPPTPNTTTGNVLDNDIGGAGTKTVTAVNSSAGSVGTSVPGSNGFGTFQIDSDGSYTYTLDDTNPEINGLNDGDTRTDSVDYTVSAGSATDTGTLTITIHGHTDGP